MRVSPNPRSKRPHPLLVGKVLLIHGACCATSRSGTIDTAAVIITAQQVFIHLPLATHDQLPPSPLPEQRGSLP